jgi:hypothetical protein
MKKASLISVTLLFAMAGQVAADWWWPPTDGATIVPPNPTSPDVVSITLSGEWPDSCIPEDSAISVTGNNIYFDVIHDVPPWVVCLAIVMGWQQTQAVGPLPAGTYTVYACLVGGGMPPVPVAEFTVTATTYYVDCVDGNDLNNGLTPETAFATIQKGIDTAQDGDTVIVLPGWHQENVDFLGKNITLTSSNPADPNIVAYTVIDEDDGMFPPTVTFRGTEDANCSIIGFNIKGYIQGVDQLIYPNPEFCARGVIDRCLIEGNAGSCGTVINGWDGTVGHCLIANNNGMACACQCSPVAVGNALIQNCTIADSMFGRGIAVGDGGTTTIENCILYNDGITLGNGATVNISFSNFHGNVYSECEFPPCEGTVNWGLGNIDADPCFADPCNGDYHLQSAAGRWDPNQNDWVIDANTSRCIDAGNPGSPPADEPTPNGNRINMGAYGGTAEASKSPVQWALLADLTNDHKMDFDDLNVFVSYWLEGGQNLPSDLDRSQTVDLSDFSIFADQWSDAYLPETSMSYQIGNCDLGAANTAHANDANEPRFSIRVEGRYIHFEDVMYANCCPDELGLENEINGNQITLYEIGYGGMCDCMCYFPITATLGPFPDGTYTVEVFDNFGQSLGVVEVTIGESAQPSITYQIGACGEGASAFSTVQQSEQTRFTVTVVGQYIHFEDMMVANCCSDELELQMTVEDDLITIYEIEHLSMLCLCICDYPTTATLGPFEPDTYTLEVYEDYGGFIGSTTVTID